jgi:hypothetical protein
LSRKFRLLLASLLSFGWLLATPAQASSFPYTLSEYNAAFSAAQSAVDSATAEVAIAQSNVNASAIYHETSTATGQVNVVVNGTFDNASAWSSIGMGDNSTILNSNIARVYNGVLIGSYNYLDFILQTGTFPSPTRQVTFSYDMSNNNFNDGARPQADQYRVEFRTYSANGTRLNYYDTRNRSDVFGWTNFTNTYNLPDDAVRWDIGFRLSDSGYWNGNFAGSIDNVSLITNSTVVTPAYTTYDPALVSILNQKISQLSAAQAALAAIPPLAINAPSQLVATVDISTITLDWNAPATNLIPERYAISWTDGTGGWGIATGNVGDANALNTSIVIDKSVIAYTGGWDKNYTFKIRSDHDSGRMYSAWSNEVTVNIVEPYTPASLPFAYQYRLDENAQLSITAPLSKMIETITAWYGDPNDGNYGALVTDTLTSLNSGETSTVISATNDVFGDPVPGVGKILIFNISYIDLPGPTLEEIAAQQEAESETARQNQANVSVSTYESATITSLSDYNPITALKDAAQSLVNLVRDLVAKAGFQSRIDYKSSAINTVKAKLEADQAAAIAEAARIEAERLAAIAAAQAAAAEQARLEAEAKAKAEAEAKAKAEEEEKARIEAEEKAKAEAEEKARIEAEEKAKEEAEAKAKAEAEEKARIEAEEKAKAEAEEKERLEAEAKAKEEAEEKAKEEAEAKAEEERIKAEEEAASKAEEEKKKAEEESKKELEEAIEDAKDGKELTEEQKEAVVESLLENVKPGEAITAAAIAASGVSYSDLPPETPVELRTDANGNEVVITAEVAAQVELITDPGAFAAELFSDPGAALAALGSIGADMSDEERKESTEAVVATVIAAGAAINAVAAAGGSAPSGGSSGGGNSGGSGNGSTGSRRNGKW